MTIAGNSIISSYSILLYNVVVKLFISVSSLSAHKVFLDGV